MQKFSKMLLFCGGLICVGLGLLGIFIPVLPTTPFLLLAAFLFARSSDRALRWLLDNRWFGAYIRNYREGKGMTVRDKVITLGTLWLTIGFGLFFVVNNSWVQLLLAGVAIGVSLHLLRIKTCRKHKQPAYPENTVDVD